MGEHGRLLLKKEIRMSMNKTSQNTRNNTLTSSTIPLKFIEIVFPP